MLAADVRAVVVDTAAAIFLQVQAGAFHEQIPAVIIFVDTNIFVRNLPQQMVKIVHGARGLQLFGDVGAAFGTVTETAFVFCGDLDAVEGGF